MHQFSTAAASKIIIRFNQHISKTLNIITFMMEDLLHNSLDYYVLDLTSEPNKQNFECGRDCLKKNRKISGVGVNNTKRNKTVMKNLTNLSLGSALSWQKSKLEKK